MKRTVWRKLLWALVNDLGCVDLVAPHPYAECAGRLRQQTNSVWNIFDSRPVTGYVGDTGFVLCKARTPKAFHTVVRGAAAEEGRQTRLRCRFGIPPSIFFLMAFWFLTLLLIASTTLGASVVAAILGSSNVNLLQDGILGSLVGTGFGIITIGIGRYLARHDQRFLVDFLIATLDAHEVPPRGEARLDFWILAARWLDPLA